MPPENASRVYARQLLPMGYGYPLYYPEPSENLSLELRKRGIGSIGDVGALMLEGSFQFAFNIFTTDTTINMFGVPHGFRKLELHDQDISCFRNKHAEKSELKTEGKYNNSGNLDLSANANDGSTALPVEFKMAYNATESTSESALLTMPHGAMGEDYNRIKDIRKYSIKNAHSWYEFINEQLGREVPNGSLYVVTGCDKSITWGIATKAENSSSSGFSLTLAVKFVSASAGYSCSWSASGGTVPRSSTASNLGPGVIQPYNQCLFIRGFKIMVREGLLSTLKYRSKSEVESIASHSNIDKLLRQGKSFPGGKGGKESGSSGQGGSSQSVGGTSHQEGADDWIDNVELDPPIGPYHPLDTINKYLLETTPQAQVAISHESDWWALSPGATLANEDETIQRLASHFTPSIESGGVFLATRESTHFGAQKDDTEMDVDYEPGIDGRESLREDERRDSQAHPEPVDNEYGSVSTGIDDKESLREDEPRDSQTSFADGILPQYSNVALLVSSVEKLGQMDTGNTASADAIMDLGECLEYVLFVGAAEWARDPEAREDNHDIFVEVKVDGSREVLRTMPTRAATHWDQSLIITGYLSSIVSIEIKSTVHNSSESFSIARAEISLENLLEICADGELAALELTIKTLASRKGPKHSATANIGIITVKIYRLPHNRSNHLQLPGSYTWGTQQISQLEQRIPEEVTEDLKMSSFEPTVALTPDGHPNKPDVPTKPGRSVDPEDVIASLQKIVALTPEGHPSKPIHLSNLARGYGKRFERLGDLVDLENAIASSQQAVALTPYGHPSKADYLSILGRGHSARFERLGDLADLENAIASSQQAVALTTDGHPSKADYISFLGRGYRARFERLGDLADLENAIVNSQQAVTITPDGHPSKADYLLFLGRGYSMRFERLGDLADLENAIANSQQAVVITPDGHQYKADYLSFLGRGYSARFERLGDLADLEDAIVNSQQAVAITPHDHPSKADYLSTLGRGYSARFERLGDLTDLETAIATQQQALALTPDGHPSKADYLTFLGRGYIARFERLGDLADLENAIASSQQAVALTTDGHPSKADYISFLGRGYRARFERLGDLADLENAIVNSQQAVVLTPYGHPQNASRLLHLGSVHTTAWNHTHEESHLHNAVLSFKLAAESPGASPTPMLRASRNWGNFSLRSGDMPSALQAFRTAIEILPQVAWLGLDNASRQDWLAKEKPEELGCMAATCAIRLGRFEEAVELLDMARSVFWQQASSVRNGGQDLKAEQPVLAEELEEVSRKLDASSFSGLSTFDDDTQLYERRLAEHRSLVLKRESLIKEIRSLPGFESFLKQTPFNRLRGAAAAGRIVIINISKLGTDALIFDRTNPIRHVPLSKVDLANSFKHIDDIELKQTRADDTQDQHRSKFGSVQGASGEEWDTDGIAQRQARTDVVEDRQSSRTSSRVWEHILKPIFTEIGIPLQRTQDQIPTNRIFWYLTGPLTFIPIHAAGPVSQLVVSSYVTTLNSLVEAQRRQSMVISGAPMLLAISQPDTPGQMPIPHATDEVNMVMQTALAAGWPEGKLQRFDRAKATVDQVSTALNTCSWVHFACHAMQDTRDGMESSFALYDGRLRLSRIAAKQLPSARFAFLSAGDSALGLENSPGEAMHLAAGMQFAGFSSIIAAMWSMRDEDAPIIAKHTYAYLLRNGLDNVDLTEAAAALHHAVSELRKDPTVTVERWAPYVYYGI